MMRLLLCAQTYSKKAVDQVQEALTQAQKTQVLSQNIFEVSSFTCLSVCILPSYLSFVIVVDPS